MNNVSIRGTMALVAEACLDLLAKLPRGVIINIELTIPGQEKLCADFQLSKPAEASDHTIAVGGPR